MEIPNPAPESPSPKGPDSSLEARVDHLASTLEQMSSDLGILKTNLQKRKSENATLKILLYIGLLVLLIGFIYSNYTIQNAQLNTLDSRLNQLQQQMTMELRTVEQHFFGEFQEMQTRIETMAGEGLQATLKRMNDSLEQVQPESERMSQLITQVQADSEDLAKTYAEYRAEALARAKKIPASPQK
ncbi:MAG: hypothetical protein COV67_01010 [Nitrospinae bacterium CG11_big_fil_rev_8_21_14_0_20_56_8]|nr:MAG: hypothetical protein COV67_01010 [Nitrospinae bacterium CG11_big_fil_rev_8_21_14_0_20_56_8]